MQTHLSTLLALMLALSLVSLGCGTWEPDPDDDDASDDDAGDDDSGDDDMADDDVGDDDVGDDDVGDDDVGDDDVGDDDVGDDDVGDDDVGDDDVGDDDTGDDDTGDDDTGDDDTAVMDADGDGFDNTVDCDDSNANTYPGATELCDGLDNDCNGQVPADEQDADNDNWMACVGDCDDQNATVNPGQGEIPNDGLDNDCDGTTDPPWLPVWPIVDDPGDHNNYLIDLLTHEYSQNGSRVAFRTTSYAPFDDSLIMVDMYIGDGTDTYTLTYDAGQAPDNLQMWSSTNSWAEPLPDPASLTMDPAAGDQITLGVDLSAVGLCGATEMDVWVGANLTGQGSYDDQYPDAGAVSVPLGPSACLAFDGIAPIEVTGNGDALMEPGEIWDLYVDVRNAGSIGATGVTGVLQYTTDIGVIQANGSFGNINPNQTAANTPAFRITIEPTAAGTEVVPLLLTSGPDSWDLDVELTIGTGLDTPAHEQWEYLFDVSGSLVTGEITVTILNANQDPQCFHHFNITNGVFTYGLNQGGWWPGIADETIEITGLADSGQGDCPQGYHDLYTTDPTTDMIPSTNTVLSFISCDIADGTFHGEDVTFGVGSGSQISWCTDVGPAAASSWGTGPMEAILLIITGDQGLAALGNFAYYISGDAQYYWAHGGILMLDANNMTDPQFGMNGDYYLWLNWIFGV